MKVNMLAEAVKERENIERGAASYMGEERKESKLIKLN